MAVYERALDFVRGVERMLRGMPGRGYAAGEQLDRAAGSVVANIAEGAGEFACREKARFYRMALRSATECAGMLDELHARHRIDNATHAARKQDLALIAAMLTALVRRFSA